MPVSAVRRKVVKKHSKSFKRHQSDRFARVSESWRKPKGIDSCVRRRFRGTIAMPKIGYGSDKQTRFLDPTGFFKVTIKSAAELEMLMMHNTKFAAEIAHTIGGRKRTALLERAKELDIKILNPKAKINTEETH